MTTTATPAADTGLPDETKIAPRLPAWRRVQDVDDAVGELHLLADLLESARQIMREIDYGLPEGGRNTALDRVSSLVTVSQGLAEYLVEAVDALPRPKRERAA